MNRLRQRSDILIAQSLAPAPFSTVVGDVILAQQHHRDPMESSVGDLGLALGAVCAALADWGNSFSGAVPRLKG